MKQANLENNKMNRRAFIKKSGAAFLVVSSAGLTWRAIDQGVFSTEKALPTSHGISVKKMIIQVLLP